MLNQPEGTDNNIIPQSNEGVVPQYIPPGTGLGLSSLEKQKRNEQLYKSSLKDDPEKRELLDDEIARFAGSQLDSLVGGQLPAYAARTINDLITIPIQSSGNPEPLNIPGNEKRVLEWESSFGSLSNNPLPKKNYALNPNNNTETIAKETAAFSFEVQQYLFSAPNYASYLERLMEVRLREMAADGTIDTSFFSSDFPFLGPGALGKSADIGSFMVASEVSLPIALAGSSMRIGTMADLVSRSATARGLWQTSKLGEEAAGLAAKMSRSGLFARGAAVGAVETILYDAARAGADPLDEYSSYDFLNSALFGSVLGGSINAVLGRRILRNAIEDGVSQRLASNAFRVGDSQTGWTYSWLVPPTTKKGRRLVKNPAFRPVAQQLEYLKDIFYGSQEARIAATQNLRAALSLEFGSAPQSNDFTSLFYNLFEQFSVARDKLLTAEGKELARLKSNGTANFVAWFNDKSGLQGLPVFSALSEISARSSKPISFDLFKSVLEETVSLGRMTRQGAQFGAMPDENAIRAGMARIINKHVPADRQIAIYDAALERINLLSFSVSAIRSLGLAGNSNVVGLTLADIPKSEGFGSRLPFGISDHLNQAAVLLGSENSAIRAVGFMSKHASRWLRTAQGMTIGESGQQALNKTLTRTERAFQRGLLQEASGELEVSFRARASLISAKKADPLFEDKFQKQVLRFLDTGEETGLSINAINAGKKIREELRYFANEAFEKGIPGFKNSNILNYSPWIWKWDRIRFLAQTAEGRLALENLLLKAFGTTNDGKRTVTLGQQMFVFDDAAEAAKILANRLSDLSEYAVTKPFTTTDDDLIAAMQKIASPLKETGGSPTPFGINRTILDREVEIPLTQDFFSLGKKSMSLGDLRETDLSFVLKKYFTSVQGAINEADFLTEFSSLLTRSGVRMQDAAGNPVDKFTGIDQIIGFLKSSRQQSEYALGPTLKNGSVEEKAINSLVGYLRFEPVVGNPSIMDKLVGIGGILSYLRFGGKFQLAGVTESARTFGSLGLSSAIKQMPVLQEMLLNWRSMSTTNKNAASMVEAMFSPAVGRVLRLNRHTPDSFEASGLGKLDKFGQKLTKVSDVYSDITLLPAVTSFSQVWTGATLIQHLYDAVKPSFRLKPAQLNLLGITEIQYDALINYVNKNGVVTDTFLGPRVISLGGKADPFKEKLLENFAYRFINTKIQSVPTRGDFADHMFSWLGRTLLQFKTFNLKGVDNFLLANTQRAMHGDALAVGKEYLNVAILSSIVLTAKNYAAYETAKIAGADRKTLEALEENLSPTGIVKAAWVGPIETGISTYFIDPVWTSFVDPDPLFGNPYSYGARQGSIFDVLGPTGLLLKNTAETVDNASRAGIHAIAPSWPMGKEWTLTEQKKAEQTFVPNLIGVKEVFDAFVAPALREGLREEQPRGSAPKKDYDPLSYFK